MTRHRPRRFFLLSPQMLPSLYSPASHPRFLGTVVICLGGDYSRKNLKGTHFLFLNASQAQQDFLQRCLGVRTLSSLLGRRLPVVNMALCQTRSLFSYSGWAPAPALRRGPSRQPRPALTGQGYCSCPNRTDEETETQGERPRACAPAAVATAACGDRCDARAGQVQRRLGSHRRLPQPLVFVPAIGSDSIPSFSSLVLFFRSRSQIPSCRNLDSNPLIAHFPLQLESISEVPKTACLHGGDVSSVWPPPETSDDVQAAMLLLGLSGFREPCLYGWHRPH
ncbi:uncharacterized protein LOC141582471 [Saimiri boliviensis]|uniref:uncharacterized protein LOC141582471 n=1 Tax=Saimiri boliviensis TaxID=27679 RepID=UPI003D78A7C3